MESEQAKLHRKAYEREYYRKNREHILARNRAYRKAHPEKQKQYRINAALKRDTGLGYYQRYYLLNKERLAEYAKQWRKRNPEKVKAYQHRYNKKRTEEKRRQKRWDSLDVGKAKSLFRDPAMAAHLQWLVDHKKPQPQISPIKV